MQCLIHLLLALLSALAFAHPSNINARDDPAVLIHCDDKNFHGHCDYGRYDRCTPILQVIRSLSVRERYQCILYNGPECRDDTGVPPRFVGDMLKRTSIFDVDFGIMSVFCRPPVGSARALTIDEANDGDSSVNIESRADIDSPANINFDWSLTICGDKDLQDSCDSAYYESCTPVGAILQVRSLSVREGIQCEFYAESACRTNTMGPFHVGDPQNRVTINSVHFPAESFKCHHFALRRDTIDAAISERGPSTEVCREGERKCSGGSLRSFVMICENGAWRAVKQCGKHEICVNEPEPHCVPH